MWSFVRSSKCHPLAILQHGFRTLLSLPLATHLPQPQGISGAESFKLSFPARKQILALAEVSIQCQESLGLATARKTGSGSLRHRSGHAGRAGRHAYPSTKARVRVHFRVTVSCRELPALATAQRLRTECGPGRPAALPGAPVRR